jgi:hypothetical protein
MSRNGVPAVVFGIALLCELPAVSGSSLAEIPQNTHVLLRMMNEVTTRTAAPGDYVYMRTASPIAVKGHIVVPVNSYVTGVVSRVKRSGRLAGRAELAIRLESLTLPNGGSFRFSPRVDSVDDDGTGQKAGPRENTVEQSPEHGRDAARVAILAGTGASIGGLTDRGWKGAGIGAGVGSAVGLATVMLTRGREVELRRGSSVDVVFDRPVSLQ